MDRTALDVSEKGLKPYIVTKWFLYSNVCCKYVNKLVIELLVNFIFKNNPTTKLYAISHFKSAGLL